jgi:hypothetical protein
MRNEKRYIFQGHAIAAEARQPGERSGAIYAAMALPVTGGYGQIIATSGPIPAGRSVKLFDSASAFVSGDFFDPKDEKASVGDCGGVARTVTAAYVNGYSLMDRVTVEKLSAHLILEDPGTGQPLIFSGDTNPISGEPEPDPIVGLRVDGCDVNIEFDPIFDEFPTLDQLQAEFRKRCRIDWYDYAIATSIVKSLSWKDENCPKRAKIDCNTIIVEGLGRIFLGELLIEAGSRHLTLVRVQLGSDERDNDAACDVVSGPQPWPPNN